MEIDELMVMLRKIQISQVRKRVEERRHDTTKPRASESILEETDLHVSSKIMMYVFHSSTWRLMREVPS